MDSTSTFQPESYKDLATASRDAKRAKDRRARAVRQKQKKVDASDVVLAPRSPPRAARNRRVARSNATADDLFLTASLSADDVRRTVNALAYDEDLSDEEVRLATKLTSSATPSSTSSAAAKRQAKGVSSVGRRSLRRQRAAAKSVAPVNNTSFTMASTSSSAKKLRRFAALLKRALRALAPSDDQQEQQEEENDASSVDSKENDKDDEEAQLMASSIVRDLYALDRVSASSSSRGSSSTTMPSECQVCYCAFDESGAGSRAVMKTCGHGMLCRGCLRSYVQTRVRDKDVMPWIPCADVKCRSPLHPSDMIASGVEARDMFALAAVYVEKVLAREPEWVECSASDECKFGFVVPLGTSKSATRECGVCGESQKVKPKQVELDSGFEKMLNDGVLRPCPACNLPTFKEYGLCNVLQCARCSIVWNWRSRATGATIAEVKNKARMEGSLWEQGELQFQLQLERDNPAAFKALLERNGIKYNPNYVRGSG